MNRLIFMFTLPKLVCEKLKKKKEKKRMSEVYFLIVQGKQSEREIEIRRERVLRKREKKRKKIVNLKEDSSILKGHL